MQYLEVLVLTKNFPLSTWRIKDLTYYGINIITTLQLHETILEQKLK